MRARETAEGGCRRGQDDVVKSQVTVRIEAVNVSPGKRVFKPTVERDEPAGMVSCVNRTVVIMEEFRSRVVKAMGVVTVFPDVKAVRAREVFVARIQSMEPRGTGEWRELYQGYRGGKGSSEGRVRSEGTREFRA